MTFVFVLWAVGAALIAWGLTRISIDEEPGPRDGALLLAGSGCVVVASCAYFVLLWRAAT